MDDHNKSNNDCNYQTWNTLILCHNIDIQSSNPPLQQLLYFAVKIDLYILCLWVLVGFFFFFNSDRKSQKLYSSSSVHSAPCNYYYFFHLDLLLELLWVHQFFIRVLKMLIHSVQQYSFQKPVLVRVFSMNFLKMKHFYRNIFAKSSEYTQNCL